MKRKFVILTISYIIGVIWGLYFNKNIALIFSFIIIIVLILKRKKFFIVLVCVMLISCIYNNKIKRNYDVKYSEINEIKLVGVIEKEFNEEEYFQKYLVRVKSAEGDYNLKNTRILLYVKKDKNVIKYGNLIFINGTFKKGNESRNYKGFNYDEYLRSKKIYGIVKTENYKILKQDDVNKYSKLLYNLNNKIKEKIYLILPNTTADLCTAIILGDKSNMDDEIIEDFSNSSLSHILAVSGMHMTYIIAIFSYILNICGKRKKNLLLIITIILFCNLVGSSESIVRATIMTIIYILGSLLYRKSDSLTNICVAGVIILIMNPYSIKSISFLLSFGGTLGIILFSSIIRNQFDYIKILNKYKILKYIKECMVISISANIIIIPIIAVYFNKISLIFIISNIFASILLSFIMPLIFISILLSFISINIAKISSTLLNLFFNLLILVSNISSKITLLNFTVVTPYEITIISYYILLCLEFIKTKLYSYQKNIVKKLSKGLIVIYLLILIFINFIKFFDRNMYIFFIDVGQGDSTLIITENNKKILIDGGGSESGEDYVGENTLVPYLLDRRIDTLDYIMISHFDSDHCKGIFSVMEKIKVKNILISKQGESSENYNTFVNLAKSKKINVIIVKSNMKVNVGKNTYIEILWPQENLIQENILNNNSIVAKLTYGNFSMLFTGDIEELAEKEILNNYDIRADVLKIAHHGSKTSTTEEFLNKVSPKISLIGVGENNKYGHPAMQTISRLNEIGCCIYRTDLYGEIMITVNKNGKKKVKTHLKGNV